MSTSSSKGSSNTSGQQSQSGATSTTPNNFAALQRGWDAAGNVLGSQNWSNILGAGVNQAGGATTASNSLNLSAGMAAQNFANGDYTNNPANAFLTPYANGSMVGTQNPGFQGMVDQISRSLQPQVDGNFAAAGRYGSGANANAFASALTNETGQLAYQNYAQQQQNQLNAANLIGGNYNTGRGQQLAGSALAPNLVSSAFAPAQALTALGFSGPSQYQQVAAAGNPGGTTSTSGTTTGTGSTDKSQSNAGLSFGLPSLFGSAVGAAAPSIFSSLFG